MILHDGSIRVDGGMSANPISRSSENEAVQTKLIDVMLLHFGNFHVAIDAQVSSHRLQLTLTIQGQIKHLSHKPQKWRKKRGIELEV